MFGMKEIMMSPSTRISLDQPALYRIVIQGRLPENWDDFFEEMTPQVETSADGLTLTNLTGEIYDQSSLHGILRRVRDLGLPLLEVKLLSDPELMINGETPMKTTRSFNSIFRIACKGIALAMSVAAIVLGILKTAAPETLISLLAIGLAALALVALDQE